MTRPKVTTKCVADSYADKRRERVVEVLDPVTGKGCLICLRRRDDGTLQIETYRCDDGVIVNGAPGMQ